MKGSIASLTLQPDSGEVGERFESGYKVIRYVPESVARKAAVLSLLLGVI